jgi:hypothetical protein
MTIPSFGPAGSLGNYTSENIPIPNKMEELVPFLKSTLEQHARLINRKDTGQYENVEVPVNQTFPGADAQSKRQIYRKIINTGTLPNAGLSTVAHGIAGIAAGWFFSRLYGSAWDPVALRGIPIPNMGNTYPIELWVDATNVYLQTAVNLNAYTVSSVTLEFFKA